MFFGAGAPTASADHTEGLEAFNTAAKGVGDPFPGIAAEIVEAVFVGRKTSDRCGEGEVVFVVRDDFAAKGSRGGTIGEVSGFCGRGPPVSPGIDSFESLVA